MNPPVNLESHTKVTQVENHVRVMLIVSMQPGNNYRVGASLLQDALNQPPTGLTSMQQVADALSVWTNEFTDENGPRQIHYPNGNFSGYAVPLVWSEMLTVWRKLTIEVDSMSAESQDQTVRENNGLEWPRFIVPPPSEDIPAPIQVGVPAQGFTTLAGYMVPNPVLCSSSYDNRWEGGALVPSPGSEYLLVRNSCVVMGGQTVSQFIVWGNPGDLTNVTSVIRDDDRYFMAGAPRQLPQTSVLQAEIVDAYRDAYIEIVEADPGLNLNRSRQARPSMMRLAEC